MMTASNPASWALRTLTSKLQMPRSTKRKAGTKVFPGPETLTNGEQASKGLDAYSTPTIPAAGTPGAASLTTAG